jgi:hypothetical protein
MNLELIYPEQLREDILSLKSELAEIKLNLQKPTENTKYLGRKEVAKLLNVNISSIHNYTVKGILTAFQLGGKIYYKKAEIEAAMIELKK